MKRILFGAVAAAALAFPAGAFDNSTCAAFLVGKWMLPVPGGANSLTMNLMDGGAMTMDTVLDGKTDSQAGAWTAKPGDAADHCKLTAIQKGEAEKPSDTTDLTVKDDKTINIAEMGDFKRQ